MKPDLSPQNATPAAGRRSYTLEIRNGLQSIYADVYTPETLEALGVLAPFDDDCRALMKARIERRALRGQLKPGHRLPGFCVDDSANPDQGRGRSQRPLRGQ